ncbi:hypothetical protein ACJMK2_036933 [Sinanodonta woodiana]|uniref:G-protein coupled receptors family 1 profile domain-containing protein n=1 Tax=Sinanodonta woodiana TaxID=1069815 RepID=A0ABD3WIQ2_SINWO
MYQSIKTDCNVQEENMDTMIHYIPNMSDHFALLTLKEINDSEAKILLPVTVFYVIVMVLGIIGNTLVIIVHKARPTRIYIVCLAALDITTCVVGIPYHVLDLVNPYMYFYPIACKLLTFLITLPLNASMIILAIVAIDRYLKLCKPLKSQQTNLESVRTCLIVLSCSLVIVSPYILIYGHSTIHTGIANITGSQCFIDDSYHDDYMFPLVYIVFQLLLFVIVTLVLIVLYIIIWRAVIKQEMYYNRLCKSANTNHRIYEIQSKLLRLSFCVRLQQKRRADFETDDTKAYATQMKSVVQLDVPGNDMCQSCPNDVCQSCPNDVCHSCPKITIHSAEKVPSADIKSRDKSNFSEENECVSEVNSRCSMVIDAEGYAKNARLQSGSVMQSRSQSDNSNDDSGTQHSHQHRTKLTKIMFTITFVFIITYLPMFCMSLLNIHIKTFWDDLSNSKRIMYDCLLRFYLLNNMAKPFIYFVWDCRFRRKCIGLFKRLVCCSAPSRDENV